MSEVKGKTAKFFRVKQLIQGEPKIPRNVPWDQFVERLTSADVADKWIDDYFYAPRDDGSLTLTLHKKISTHFMARLHAENGSILDIVEEEGEDGGLAQSSVVVLFPGTPCFAWIPGQMHAPQASRMANALDAFLAAPTGTHWKVEPVMNDTDLKKFQAADGVLTFKSKFTTVKDLFDSEAEDAGPVDMAERMADAIGGNLSIGLQLELEASARNSSNPARELKRLISKNLRQFVQKRSGSAATIIDAQGREELINLVEQQLASDVEVTVADGKIKFSDLCNAVAAQRDDLYTSLSRVLGGSDGEGS